MNDEHQISKFRIDRQCWRENNREIYVLIDRMMNHEKYETKSWSDVLDSTCSRVDTFLMNTFFSNIFLKLYWQFIDWFNLKRVMIELLINWTRYVSLKFVLQIIKMIANIFDELKLSSLKLFHQNKLTHIFIVNVVSTTTTTFMITANASMI